jgi:hypothetical protein
VDAVRPADDRGSRGSRGPRAATSRRARSLIHSRP